MAGTQRVVVTGATGLIGKALCGELRARGYSLAVCSRRPATARRLVPGAVDYLPWDPAEPGRWAAALDGARAVINLAGTPLFGRRWSEGYKRRLRDSRVRGTRALVDVMEQARTRPRVFVSASAVGYYGCRDDTPLDERAPAGDDFLARLCRDWEATALRVEAAGVRTVVLRTGIVLDRKEGALPLMRLPFRLFAGGPILPGSQWLSWIHIADEVGIILLALEDERVRGPLNVTAPQPQTNRDVAKTLGKVTRSPSWLPVPGLALRLLFGAAADVLTGGQRAIPAKAREFGYIFRYPDSEQALRHLLAS